MIKTIEKLIDKYIKRRVKVLVRHSEQTAVNKAYKRAPTLSINLTYISILPELTNAAIGKMIRCYEKKNRVNINPGKIGHPIYKQKEG